MSGILKKLISPFREFGIFAGLLYIIDRLLRQVSPNLRLYFYEMLVQPISDEPLLPARFLGALEVREIRRGDPEVALMPARPDIKELRFQQNATCLGAFHRGKFIGHIWFCSRSYEEDEVRCTFLLPDGDESVFDFDLYI